MRDHLAFLLNGREITARGDAVFSSLARWLRSRPGLTGTKIVCEEGDCGACTVLVGRLEDDELRYRPVNGCIQFLYQLDGCHVVTVEGLAKAGGVNAVQQAMVEHQGAQCGYCTPGFVVAMTEGLVERQPRPDEEQVRRALTGNLCRCTGYEPIIKAALEAHAYTAPTLSELYPPAQVMASLERWTDGARVDADGRVACIPTSLDEALAFKAEHPDATVVQGATDVGVWCMKRGFAPHAVLALNRVRELDRIEVGGGELQAGGGVRLADLQAACSEAAPELARMLEIFGSPQIRHAGTLAGNIVNASPIADTVPFLFVTGASVDVASTREKRRLAVDELYLGYKELALEDDELVTGVTVPLPAGDELLRLYKVSKRRDLDISTFTAAVRMRLDGGRMTGVGIAYGGVAPVVLRLPETEAALEGKEPSEAVFRQAGKVARGEVDPITDVRGTADFRLQLAENILMKLYLEELASSRPVAV